MGDLADELVLLLLPTDKWRQIGYPHDGSRATTCGALLAEEWVAGGPAPTPDAFVHGMRKGTSKSLERVLKPLLETGRVEIEGPPRKLLGLIPMELPYYRVRDTATRDAVFHRLEQSLGAKEPPPLRDATLGAVLVAGKQWDKTGLDGPEPRPRVYAGSDPPPWGPLMQTARLLAAGQAVPAGVTDPTVLPMIAHAVRDELMFHST